MCFQSFFILHGRLQGNYNKHKTLILQLTFPKVIELGSSDCFGLFSVKYVSVLNALSIAFSQVSWSIETLGKIISFC